MGQFVFVFVTRCFLFTEKVNVLRGHFGSSDVVIVLPPSAHPTLFSQDGQSHESHEGDGSREGHEGYEEEGPFVSEDQGLLCYQEGLAPSTRGPRS